MSNTHSVWCIFFFASNMEKHILQFSIGGLGDFVAVVMIPQKDCLTLIVSNLTIQRREHVSWHTSPHNMCFFLLPPLARHHPEGPHHQWYSLQGQVHHHFPTIYQSTSCIFIKHLVTLVQNRPAGPEPLSTDFCQSSE